MKQAIIGISAYYHDSAACIIVDGEIIAAVQEERLTRKKHDECFPAKALQYVINQAQSLNTEIIAVAFYDKPFIKFERLLETYHAFAPKGLTSFLQSMPVWIKEKLFQKDNLKKELKKFGLENIPLLFPEHHLSHAASAFYPSPFNEAAILTIDGVGEWATTTISKGNGKDITVLSELHFPHSIGLLYSAFTYYCGFKVNSGEYKLMGLAPYGNITDAQTQHFIEIIKSKLVDIRPDGSILLNQKYFNYSTGLRMTHDKKWTQLFGIKPRTENMPLTQDYMNLALAIQKITDEIVIKLAQHARQVTGLKNLVMAGGVALNCVSNGKIYEQNIFDSIWIQPAAGDAGGSIGAALAAWHIWQKNERIVNPTDSMKGSYLGNSFTNNEIEHTANYFDATYEFKNNFNDLAHETAKLLSDGNIIGWFQDSMEFGPRALGNRTILADPRNAEMQKKLNLKIKFREGFRPFAPAVLEEDTAEYFNFNHQSPYMLFVAPVADKRRHPLPSNYENFNLNDKLYFQRSDIPSVTHIDYSARLQTVSSKTNPKFHTLITSFKALTGYGLLVNTSFNVRGEPIVCTPNEAYLCFMRTNMDFLVIGNYIFDKKKQPKLDDTLLNIKFALD